MRRPMETMLLGYPALKDRLEKEGKPVILLDILQEVNKCVGPHRIRLPSKPPPAFAALCPA